LKSTRELAIFSAQTTSIAVDIAHAGAVVIDDGAAPDDQIEVVSNHATYTCLEWPSPLPLPSRIQHYRDP
jgi:hypothetical protein